MTLIKKAGLENTLLQCTKCVLDTSTSLISFDKNGVCNYCHDYEKECLNLPSKSSCRKQLNTKIAEIKDYGRGKPYDCLIGLSGGVDSSYLAYLAVKVYKLRPLAVHFDNGWNSELAVLNIDRLLDHLGIDLQTYVVNWENFKDLQLAYIKASVVDLEVPTDHFISATMNKFAYKKDIKYILNGCNFVTEAILPADWAFHQKEDLKNLLDIHKHYGTHRLKQFPKLGYWQRVFYQKIAKIEQIYLLDMVDYNKKEAKQILEQELEWQDYGGKHYESLWTRFYQGHLLPKKYGIDKRKAHLSTLICSGQMSREEALSELKCEPYPKNLQNADKKYVQKKLGISDEQFVEIMNTPRREHSEFKTEIKLRKMWDKKIENFEEFVHYLIHPIEALKYMKYFVFKKFQKRINTD